MTERDVGQIRRKDGEPDEAFMTRLGMTKDDFELWKRVTLNGQRYRDITEDA